MSYVATGILPPGPAGRAILNAVSPTWRALPPAPEYIAPVAPEAPPAEESGGIGGMSMTTIMLLGGVGIAAFFFLKRRKR